MNLPTLNTLDLNNKKVFIRLDLDVNLDQGRVVNEVRLASALETIKFCLNAGTDKIILAGHRGRPQGKYEKSLSTFPLINFLSEKLEKQVIPLEFKPFLEDFTSLHHFYFNHPDGLFLLENLRFWTGEEKDDQTFALALSEFVDVYVNEAFASSHRKHTSVHALPKLMKNKGNQVAFGNRFITEIDNLNQVLSSESPKIINLNGKKKDKLDHLDGLKQNFDKVLIGGRLPENLPEDFQEEKVILARLVQDKSDITINSMEIFEKEIKSAKTVVVSGPVSVFEEQGHQQGTIRIFQAVKNNSEAFRVAGGGDTEAALDLLGFNDAFNWVSTGGGAMLEYLSTQTLPAIEVVK